MSTKATAKDFLWPLALLVPVVLLIIWYVWLPPLLLVLLVRHLRKPRSQKVAERERAKAKHAETLRRVDTVIQMQLAAHGLPNTPRNRALVATAISQDRSSGIGR
ncbi:hypothetical protein KBY57_12885 [Cyanobium sp. Aljojuca 7D2]|uniref:hypothetical protein n=1 Tax=Cyanobium sp. Aljojuca 7D2 TaxID=2823698 RepID=UPI0020CCE30A|nr:hypothetical protein [Cyanobium sp. Aljojuca 7D2]MCP9891940.1 hypothetical protein [Cyanobium sp. Aljojuca 7D2]